MKEKKELKLRLLEMALVVEIVLAGVNFFGGLFFTEYIDKHIAMFTLKTVQIFYAIACFMIAIGALIGWRMYYISCKYSFLFDKNNTKFIKVELSKEMIKERNKLTFFVIIASLCWMALMAFCWIDACPGLNIKILNEDLYRKLIALVIVMSVYYACKLMNRYLEKYYHSYESIRRKLLSKK